MNFQHYYSSNHSNMMIFCSRNISDYYQCCCTHFCGIPDFFPYFF